MSDDAPGNATGSHPSSTLDAEQLESLDLYAVQLKHKAITPRQWLKSHSQVPLSEEFREQLWYHYSIAYPPPKVPGFMILDILGEGGMGKVYLGKDRNLNRHVAIKELSKEVRRDAGFRERFRREAEYLAKSKHPNIVEVYQFLPHDGREFIVMEHADQGSLSDRLVPGRPETPHASVQWLIKIARAIGCAHKEQIIHRDLKPGNILFDKRGEPKVSDFGLAKNLLDPTDRTHGGHVGTERYMAPEQTDGKPPTPETDIWALGVILYRLLTGQLPFDGKTQKELFANICSASPVAMGAAVPEPLQSICLKCLEKRPEDRYHCAEDLALALVAHMPGEPTAFPAADAKRLSRHRRVIGWVGATSALLLILTALAIGWKLHDRRLAPERMNELHTGYCSSIVFGPAGQRAFSESGTVEVFVWDVAHHSKEESIKHGYVPEPRPAHIKLDSGIGLR